MASRFPFGIACNFVGSTRLAVGRSLADGADVSYICDVAVHSDNQATGLGKEVMNRLKALSKGHKKIILYSVPGKKFFRKLGFLASGQFAQNVREKHATRMRAIALL